MPKYGFKNSNKHDQLAISNVLSQADRVEQDSYPTLAQYEIKDVDLKPLTVSFNKPRQWALTVNTNLRGFNDKKGQAIYFNDEKAQVGDGYAAYPLKAEQLASMLKGGLYEAPTQYMQTLKDKLVGQQFYRQSRANLMTAHVYDSHLDVHVGDFKPQHTSDREYLIGRDLQAYTDFPKQLSKQTNFEQILGKSLDQLEKSPVKAPEIKSKQRKAPLSKTPSLQDVTVDTEVDLSGDQTSIAPAPNENHSEKSEKPASLAQVQVDQETVAPQKDLIEQEQKSQVPVESEVPADSGEPDTVDDILKQLEVDSATQPKKKTAYEDDFMMAAADSKASQHSQQVKQNKRQTAQRQQSETDGPDL